MKKIAVISDSHDDLFHLSKAVEIIKAEKADMIIHLGDFIAPFTLKTLKKAETPMLGVFGNNDGEKYGLMKGMEGWGEIHMPPYKFTIEGTNLLLCHSPMLAEEIKKDYPDIKLFLHGHTHIQKDEIEDSIRIINPGEVCGYLSNKSSFGFLTLPEFEYITIEIK